MNLAILICFINEGIDRVLIVRKFVGPKEAPYIYLRETMFDAISKLRTDFALNELPVGITVDQTIFNHEYNVEPIVPPPLSTKIQREEDLPVHKHRHEILRAITSNQVVVISGETGMIFILNLFLCSFKIQCIV